MKEFTPDFRNVVDAARNITPDRMPIYEHIISEEVMETILGREFKSLKCGSRKDKREYFDAYCGFFKDMGYDTVSYEELISAVLPGSGALYRHSEGVIKNRRDFESYPWDEIEGYFFDAYTENFSVLRESIPPGMRGIGGPGNGIFECVQDVVGFTELSYLLADDPELYEDLFKKMGEVFSGIWKRFLSEFGDIYAVCRFGDDLGFKGGTLLPPDDIRRLIIPQYRNVVELVHASGKPFLLHSCGNIFSVMDDIIEVAGIDAKHSNEDAIAPFSEWVNRYGARIGNFGGVDTDVICQKSEDSIAEYVREVIAYSRPKGGFALGSGNSIPEYVPASGYLSMVNTARSVRGDFA
jgi:uroporphyrinogen decarboxylase